MCPSRSFASNLFRLLALGSAALASLAFEPSAIAAPAAAKQIHYVLRPMDLVKVQVFHEPELDRELRVSQDYTIVMPLIGVVDVRK